MASLLIAVIFTAILFDYINGFHDAANAIAASVSTRVFSLRLAVLVAAVLNFAGALAGTAVAKTIASGFADAAQVTQVVVLGALGGACVWNLLTWWFGIPSSSSHALIGGLAGGVTAHAGAAAFRWSALWTKVVLPLVLSPTIGFCLAFTAMILLTWGFRRTLPRTVTKVSRRLQLLSACAMAFSHGSNDAQKSMGIITLALASWVAHHGRTLPEWMVAADPSEVPLWTKVVCAGAISLGTFAGGKRIIKTMGTKLIRITPLQGFASDSTGAITILTASHFGLPVSTTHCINACILGSGASRRLSAVRWGVAGNLVVAWILTLPLSGLVSFFATLVCMRIFA